MYVSECVSFYVSVCLCLCNSSRDVIVDFSECTRDRDRNVSDINWTYVMLTLLYTIDQLPKLCVKISILRHRRMWVRSFSRRVKVRDIRRR